MVGDMSDLPLANAWVGQRLLGCPTAEDLIFCFIFVLELALRVSAFGKTFLNMHLARASLRW